MATSSRGHSRCAVRHSVILSVGQSDRAVTPTVETALLLYHSDGGDTVDRQTPSFWSDRCLTICLTVFSPRSWPESSKRWWSHTRQTPALGQIPRTVSDGLLSALGKEPLNPGLRLQCCIKRGQKTLKAGLGLQSTPFEPAQLHLCVTGAWSEPAHLPLLIKIEPSPQRCTVESQ